MSSSKGMWKPDEDLEIISNAGRVDIEMIAEALNRTVGSVRGRVYLLNNLHGLMLTPSSRNRENVCTRCKIPCSSKLDELGHCPACVYEQSLTDEDRKLAEDRKKVQEMLERMES